MQVYFNLHKKAWSIRDPKTGRVVNKGLTDTLVVLRDVRFQISEAGRQRVIREKRKNVHAFANGTVVVAYVDWTTLPGTVSVSYNPYKAGHFVRTDTGEAVHSCKLLVMSCKLIEIFKDGKPTGKLKRIPVVKAVL